MQEDHLSKEGLNLEAKLLRYIETKGGEIIEEDIRHMQKVKHPSDDGILYVLGNRLYIRM